MNPLPKEFAKALMSEGTSKQNKLWLIAGWSRQYDFQWKWHGEPITSRMMFSFDGGKTFKQAKSYEEDIWPKLKWEDGTRGRVFRVHKTPDAST